MHEEMNRVGFVRATTNHHQVREDCEAYESVGIWHIFNFSRIL